jgi:hypothetical protein
MRLQFLRKHPEVASESVVWHTHDLTGDKPKEPQKIEYKYIPGAGDPGAGEILSCHPERSVLQRSRRTCGCSSSLRP